jgi:hypothetical protein
MSKLSFIYHFIMVLIQSFKITQVLLMISSIILCVLSCKIDSIETKCNCHLIVLLIGYDAIIEKTII